MLKSYFAFKDNIIFKFLFFKTTTGKYIRDKSKSKNIISSIVHFHQDIKIKAKRNLYFLPAIRICCVYI